MTKGRRRREEEKNGPGRRLTNLKKRPGAVGGLRETDQGEDRRSLRREAERMV